MFAVGGIRSFCALCTPFDPATAAVAKSHSRFSYILKRVFMQEKPFIATTTTTTTNTTIITATIITAKEDIAIHCIQRTLVISCS